MACALARVSCKTRAKFFAVFVVGGLYNVPHKGKRAKRGRSRRETNVAQDKEQELIRLLKTSATPLTARVLSERLGVSVRTVKNYVKRANESGAAQIASGQDGYRIDALADSQADAAGASNARLAADIPQNNLERSAFIMKRLIQEPGGCNVFDLCEELYISISTMKTVLSILRRKLAHFDLRLIQADNHIEAEGAEKNKRRLLSELLYQESTSSFLDLGTIQQAFPDLDPAYTLSCVQGVLAEHRCFANDYSLINIVLHTTISMDRVRARHSVDAEGAVDAADGNKPQVNDIEHVIAAEIAQRLEERFAVAFPPSEVDEIALLVSTRASRLDWRQATQDGLREYVGDECLGLVDDVVRDLKEHFGIDLGDPDFCTRFALHLKSLLARARRGERARNPLTQQIRSSCPLLYDTAVAEAATIGQKTGLEIVEDEIGYIAFHLGSSIEVQKQLTDKVPVALYCPSYYQIDKQIQQFLSQYFENDILVVDVVTTESELDYVPGIELLVSTVPVRCYSRTPVIMISPFPSPTDRKEIGRVVEQIREERVRARVTASLRGLIKPELFVSACDRCGEASGVATRDEAIHLMAGLLEQQGFVSPGFEQEILRREELSSTAFSRFAIPHTVHMGATRSAIAVLSSARGVDWDGVRVNLVFMLAFNKNDADAFYEVFDPLIGMLSDPDKIGRLVGVLDYEVFIERLCALMA